MKGRHSGLRQYQTYKRQLMAVMQVPLLHQGQGDGAGVGTGSEALKGQAT